MLQELATVVAALWAGMLIGVSFIATPVKFRVQDLTRPVALEIGRVTFRLFARVEWLLALVLLIIALSAGTATWQVLLAGLAAGLVVLQSVWLLPALNRRVGALAAGVALGPSSTHQIYAVAESVKFLALLVLIAVGIGHGCTAAP